MDQNYVIYRFGGLFPCYDFSVFFMLQGCRETMMSDFGCCGHDWQWAAETESVSDILVRRYASKEINKTEYEERKEVND